MGNNTSFARYYENDHLFNYSMSNMEVLITEEKNKKEIANIVYHRFYDRYLKLLFFNQSSQKTYIKDGKKKILNQFNAEFKSGFIIMTSCCLVIESISTFISGLNEVNKPGSEVFESVFKKAKNYNNPLRVFSKQPIYSKIRCGILHQGETYGKFKLTRNRKAELFNKSKKTINATLFVKALKDFLDSYKKELESEDWNSEIWGNCRTKIRFIIENSNK
jgi:hypothetical protein